MKIRQYDETSGNNTAKMALRGAAGLRCSAFQAVGAEGTCTPRALAPVVSSSPTAGSSDEFLSYI